MLERNDTKLEDIGLTKVNEILNNPETSSEDVGQALEYAAKEGHLGGIQAILSHQGKNQASKEYVGFSLGYAALKDHPECVRAILNHIGDNKVTATAVGDALYDASHRGCDLECLQAILNHTGDNQASCTSVKDAFKFAAKNGNLECLHVFLNKTGATSVTKSSIISALSKVSEINHKNLHGAIGYYELDENRCRIMETLFALHAAVINSDTKEITRIIGLTGDYKFKKEHLLSALSRAESIDKNKGLESPSRVTLLLKSHLAKITNLHTYVYLKILPRVFGKLNHKKPVSALVAEFLVRKKP